MAVTEKSDKLKDLQETISRMNIENSELQNKIDKLELKSSYNQNVVFNADDFNNILKIISTGYFTYNLNTSQFLVSEPFTYLFQSYLNTDNINLDSFLNIIHPDDKITIADMFSLAKASKKRINGQFRISPKSKEGKETRFYSINIEYNKDNSEENIATCVIREITREIKQLREVQRSKEKSQESDNLKTVFLSTISHNIRTPMNSILGFAELLSISDPGAERRKEYVRLIKKQSKNLLQLIDEVSEIARYESGTLNITKTKCNLDLLLKEIFKDCNNLKTTLQKDQIGFSLNLPKKETVEVYTDTGRLHQVFINLINYTLKCNSQGNIEIGYKLPGDGKIEFFIKCTSATINKEEQKDLFSQYNQFDINNISRYDEEIGLGFTIAKGILKLLGGRIWLVTEEDDSVSINFSIPFEPVPSIKADNIEDEVDRKIPYRWNNKVILIVEDEEVNGLFLEAVFHDTEARTLYAKNGFQAIELCKTISKIDLILMDIRMPVMNGLKATQEIRKFNQNIPIIAQTALSLEEDRQQCLLAGCNDAVTKPIDVEELLFILNKYLS
jgi:CheY-like chemotaxis protein